MITQLLTKIIIYSITFVVLTTLLKNIHMIKNKFKKAKPRQLEAEWLVYNMRKKQIQPAKVVQAYNTTKFNFNKALKNKDIERCQVLAIRNYLETHVDKYELKGKKYKNDAHAIYSLLKSRSLKQRDYMIINTIIGV